VQYLIKKHTKTHTQQANTSVFVCYTYNLFVYICIQFRLQRPFESYVCCSSLSCYFFTLLPLFFFDGYFSAISFIAAALGTENNRPTSGLVNEAMWPLWTVQYIDCLISKPMPTKTVLFTQIEQKTLNVLFVNKNSFNVLPSNKCPCGNSGP